MHTTNHRTPISLLLCAVAALVSCSSGAGVGNVTFTTWGEEYIEAGIPASEFEDGWSVKYSTFLIVLGGVKVADGAGVVGGEMSGTKLFNHVAPQPKAVFEASGLAAQPWPKVSYQLVPASSATALGAGATESDKAAMVAGGLGLYVEGKATKGAESRSFKWGFAAKTLFDACKGEVSGKEVDGANVTNGGTDSIELTIHGDHLFYDDLQSPSAKLRFQNLADADADKNGEITLAELEATKLARLPKENGPYGTGSAADIVDLKAYVTALTRTVGHFRGEGECLTRPIP